MEVRGPNDGRPPRVPAEIVRLPGIVQIELFQRVGNALEAGETPILLLGGGGSGKTTFLRGLADEWAKLDRKAIFLSLYESGRGEDILLTLRRYLAEYSELPHDADIAVVAGSSRAALRATIHLVESAPPDLLVVFDGLDEMADQSQVIQLLLRWPTGARIVVSSRFEPRGSSRVFRSVFQIPRFTEAEVVEFIRRSGGPALDQAAVKYIAQTSGGVPLAITLLLDLVRREGIPSAPGTTDSMQAIAIRFINRTIANADPVIREEYFRALISLAVLNRSVRASEYPASVLQRTGTSELLVSPTEAGIFFAHPFIREAVLALADLTDDSADFSLSSLKFGAEEAERDSLLSDSFISLPEFSNVFIGRKNIVIGDRGTGKSAMFSHLSMPVLSGSLRKVPLVKPLTHPADMLRRLEANGSQLSTADQFRAGWLTLVAYCIADHVKTFSSPAHARAAIYLKEMLGSESQTGWMVFRFLKGIADRILRSSVKIKLGPIEIDPAGKPGAKGASSIDLREFITDAAKSLAATGQIALVPLDRVDEIHKYDRELQQKAVQGLFLAEGDLAQLEGIRLVIFLRSDLFKIYDIQEKNKLVSRSMSISWTKPQLLRFLVDRVLSNACLHKVKDFVSLIPTDNHEVAMAALFPAKIEDMSAAEWLWEWMENGNGDVSPRQLILLLILAAQSPVAQQAKMNKLPIFPAAALQWGMNELSELSFKELVDDFRVAPTFLANCRADRVKSFELAKVETLFSKDEGSISVQVERLERLGFLERVILQNPDGAKTSQFEVPKLFTRSWGVA